MGGLMARTQREFQYTNKDGQEGFVQVSWGPWGKAGDLMSQHAAPIMVSFEDAPWMGVEQAEEFAQWFRVALAEAKRLHVDRWPADVSSSVS
jgi:hypothetical protein